MDRVLETHWEALEASRSDWDALSISNHIRMVLNHAQTHLRVFAGTVLPKRGWQLANRATFMAEMKSSTKTRELGVFLLTRYTVFNALLP